MRSLSTRAAGLIVLIAGLWGGLIPFVGPYFDFTLGPDKAWTWTSGRFWLDVVPGAVAVLAGLILLRSGPRLGGRLGALLGIAAGAWFVVGPDISLFWNAVGSAGAANGGRVTRVLEGLTFHSGLGVLIAVVSAYALPGLLRRPAPVAADATAGAAAGARAGGLAGRRRRGDGEHAPARAEQADRAQAPSSS